jgi:hypothetical protein
LNNGRLSGVIKARIWSKFGKGGEIGYNRVIEGLIKSSFYKSSKIYF